VSPGSARLTSASRRAQTPTTAADLDPPRPLLLDHPPTRVAAVVGGADHRETGHRGPVASSRLCLHWRWRSRRRGGRPRISEEIRTLIRRMATENADWGAPRVHGELVKLGFDVSERSVARYLRCFRTPRRFRFPLVGLPRQSPRGDRRLRFLHGPHPDLPTALVLRRDRTPSAHDPALQRDSRAHSRLGCATTA
jgi:hypothetical protein